MIFETKRLQVRELVFDDVSAFHQMQSNPNVMKFADGEIKNFENNALELKELIKRYQLKAENDFCIYAVTNKVDNLFVGTIAIVKDGYNDTEIGYRFLEKFWHLGYGSEICEGIILHCKNIGLKKIIAYVIDENIASVKILEKNNFTVIKKFISDDIQLPETKYELRLLI